MIKEVLSKVIICLIFFHLDVSQTEIIYSGVGTNVRNVLFLKKKVKTHQSKI